MLHAAAGHRVEQMIRVAARTVNNAALRADFERSGIAASSKEIRFPTPLTSSLYIAPMQRELIATGDLQRDARAIVTGDRGRGRQTTAGRLELFQTWFVRVTLVIVVYSAVYTCASLFLSAHR